MQAVLQLGLVDELLAIFLRRMRIRPSGKALPVASTVLQGMYSMDEQHAQRLRRP